MNWKRIFAVGTPIVVVAVAVVFVAKSCSNTGNSVSNSNDAILKEIVDAKDDRVLSMQIVGIGIPDK